MHIPPEMIYDTSKTTAEQLNKLDGWSFVTPTEVNKLSAAK